MMVCQIGKLYLRDIKRKEEIVWAQARKLQGQCCLLRQQLHLLQVE